MNFYINKQMINDLAQRILRESIESESAKPLFDDYGNIFGFEYSFDDIVEAVVEELGHEFEFYNKENGVELYARLESDVWRSLDKNQLEDLVAELAYEASSDAKEARYRQSDLERATAGGVWI